MGAMAAESRRQLLARMMREATRAGSPLVERRVNRVRRAIGEEPAAGSAPRAAPVGRMASPEEAVELACELGLGRHEADVRAALREGLALTIAGKRRDARASGIESAAALLTLSLEEPQLEGSCLAAAHGSLRLLLDERGSWRLSHDPAVRTATHTARSLRDHREVELASTRELLLPREWSDQVQELGLDDAGLQAWGRLRSRLAALQGRELYGELDSVVSHRWLGLPDDRSGSMPLECELRTEGLFEAGLAPWAHPQAARLSRCSGRWRLLLQLSPDQALGWSFGGSGERLYIWMTDEDLLHGRFDRSVAVQR
jgi:hypothetical protein